MNDVLRINMNNDVVWLTRSLLQNRRRSLFFFPNWDCTLLRAVHEVESVCSGLAYNHRLSSVPGLQHNIRASLKGSCASLVPKSPPRQQILFQLCCSNSWASSRQSVCVIKEWSGKFQRIWNPIHGVKSKWNIRGPLRNWYWNTQKVCSKSISMSPQGARSSKSHRKEKY